MSDFLKVIGVLGLVFLPIIFIVWVVAVTTSPPSRKYFYKGWTHNSLLLEKKTLWGKKKVEIRPNKEYFELSPKQREDLIGAYVASSHIVDRDKESGEYIYYCNNWYYSNGESLQRDDGLAKELPALLRYAYDIGDMDELGTRNELGGEACPLCGKL